MRYDLEVGTEGIFSTIKKKIVEHNQKHRAYKESLRAQKEKDNASKQLTVAQAKEKMKNVEKVAKEMYKEIEKGIKSAGLKSVDIRQNPNYTVANMDEDPSLRIDVILLEVDEDSKYDIPDDEWNKFCEILDDVYGKYNSKLGFKNEGWFYDHGNGCVFIQQDGYYYIKDYNVTESKIVEAVLEKYGVEGVTAIIKNLTK